MTVTQLYIQKLKHPELIGENDIPWLENIIKNFPYFQSARALYLKGLHNERSHLYNAELKKTAAYTTDRDVLFDFITSEQFATYKPLAVENLEVSEEHYITIKKQESTLEENIEKSVLSTLAYIENTEKENQLLSKLEQWDSSKNRSENETVEMITPNEETKHLSNPELETIKEELEIGKPLTFERNEKHSFAEWLNLTRAQPIERKVEEKSGERPNITEKNNNETVNERLKKIELIDRFIENNPKIIPSKQMTAPPAFIERNEESESFLMTETLAKIYLEQKKYQKAIQAYEILILKYPEKSSLFADRIEYIKKIQQYNK